jgi:tRNA(fMet)-specific endonuclease VapC
MILLDSDHLTVLRFTDSERRNRLNDRLLTAQTEGELLGVTVTTIEETMRGWLAAIAREQRYERQIPAYRELALLFSFFAGFEIAMFDEAAAEKLNELKTAKIRVSTMDLKIAAITLAHDALLLTTNRRDFEKVPGLRFENWLDSD